MNDGNKSRSDDLHVVVFAGPNGSGKTSLIDEIKQTGLTTVQGVYPLPVYFINPDQVAKDLQGDFPNQDARDEAAQHAAMRLRAEATESKLPFAFETHDRLMLDTGFMDGGEKAVTYVKQESLLIRYSIASAPKVTRHGLPSQQE
jgi:predicted ATPase